MKNTGKKFGVRWDKYNWKFERTIWEDENGDQFIKVNGEYFNIEGVKYGCDDWYVAF